MTTYDRRMALPTDPKTGFPLVPDNYYFKVEKQSMFEIVGVGLYRIDKKVSFFRKREYEKHVQLDWRWGSVDNLPPAEEFDWIARGLWLDLLESQERERLLGTYPPNRLA